MNIKNDSFTKMKPVTVFAPGMFGSAAYRIPSLLTTRKGTLIAGIDVRWAGTQDNPNHISLAIRRSTDEGETWRDIQLLVEYPGEGADGAAAIDSALLEDRITGTLWMLYSHTPGGIGLWASQQSLGFNEDGLRLLYDESGQEYILNVNGEVTDKTGANTNYVVKDNGDVLFNGEYSGNIYLKEDIQPRSLLEARTSFLQVIKSEDDGITWSKPIELNAQVKKSWMKFIGAGPGRGLQLTADRHRGRLVFPVYFTNQDMFMSNSIIYSDDHGQTWQMGESPNDGRMWEGEMLSAETMKSFSAQLTESQVVEMDNGDLKILMRNHAATKRTAVAVSKDGGQSWGEVSFASELIDPICQATVINYPDLGDGKLRLIWANPADPDNRILGTVRLSEDGGHTWTYSRTVNAGPYYYSCLTVLPSGELGLLYEGDEFHIYFIKFSIDWIKGM
ncbi:sialidase family protein [Paenibacillus dokdonensis]|uniref:sialidase family protein n=1 Tax=Paenibacillus dokdonensis TaxID=2567944 RepID=UPI0010A89639|nr:sialidase family protein [Paenibacillus dokdonensis]